MLVVDLGEQLLAVDLELAAGERQVANVKRRAAQLRRAGRRGAAAPPTRSALAGARCSASALAGGELADRR